MPKISVVIKEDNREKVIKATKKSILRALSIIGGKGAEYAAQLAPVDTGLLKNSLTYALAGESPQLTTYFDDNYQKSGAYSGQVEGRSGDTFVIIGTNVEYAEAQEFGTSRGVEGKHYLENGIKTHIDEFKDILTEELKNMD